SRRASRPRSGPRPRTATSTPRSPSSGRAATGGTVPSGRGARRRTPRAAGPAPRRSSEGTGVPELPQMQALAERIEAWLGGATFEGYEPLGFSGLKTAVPAPDELVGRALSRVGRRAKYVILEFDGEPERRVVFHLSQAGRVDFEEP